MGGGLYFQFMKDAVHELLERGGYLDDIGRENIFAPQDDVIGTIYRRLDSNICRQSAARIFPRMPHRTGGWRRRGRAAPRCLTR